MTKSKSKHAKSSHDEYMLEYKSSGKPVDRNAVFQAVIPNLSKECLSPVSIRFNMKKEFSCRASVGGKPLFNYAEGFFKLYSEVDLSPSLKTILDGEDISLELHNKSEAQYVNFFVKYRHNNGHVIQELKVDKFSDELLGDIYNVGIVNQIIIFSEERDIVKCRLVNIYNPNSEKLCKVWPEPIEFSPSDGKIVIDFRVIDKKYTEYLRYMRLEVESAEGSDDICHDYYIVVIGFKSQMR